MYTQTFKVSRFLKITRVLSIYTHTHYNATVAGHYFILLLALTCSTLELMGALEHSVKYQLFIFRGGRR